MKRVVLIVLAAGESRRMGRPKALLPAGRTTFLGQIAQRAHRAGLDVLVVTGAHAREIALAHPELTQVVNRRWRSGQWSSVKIGLRAAKADRVLIQPVDAPHVRADTYARLARARPPAFAAFGEEPGHPVLVDRAACLRSRAKTLAQALEALEAVAVPTKDRAVLQNLNTPRDLGATER
jgi:CTP:molybdopterin cytidylyltransferase MocA